jgi:oligo-1,6-glucosidase
MNTTGTERRWWKEAVVYQLYPRSFNDSDGDGIGDLRGIAERIEYLDELGVDAVWLNPVYASPNADNGYDIADYRAIMSEFGTMADWEALVGALHDRGIRLIMDLVVNHTSDEHEWFRKSRAHDPEYADFYWWREGADADAVGWDTEGGPAGEAPPNGWQSIFGGPAWSYDETREQWYLHLFDEKQPDLYWPNPEVRAAIYDLMEWWLAKGVDGFRLDAIAHVAKAEGLPTDLDAALNGVHEYAGNVPHLHEYLTEMNDRVLDREVMTVGEVMTPTVPDETIAAYLDPDRDGLSMLTHGEHVSLGHADSPWESHEWSLPALKAVIDRWDGQTQAIGWIAQFLSSHDEPRQVSRFGSERYRKRSATLLGTLTHTLRGTPFVYQGEELGMTNYPWTSLGEFRDVDTINPVERAIAAGEIDSFESVSEAVAARSRDNARTPMQWNGTAHAGFTDGDPWLPVNPNYEEINVERARADPESVLEYYRALIALRSDPDLKEALVYGTYEDLLPAHDSLWAYTRTAGDGEGVFVLLNFADDPTSLAALSADALRPASIESATALSVILGNADPDETTPETLREGSLGPWEARIYRVD